MSRQSILLAALGVVLLIALWWMFLYSPGQEQLAQVETEISAAQAEQATLQQRVTQLEGVRSRAPETEAAIARLESLLPNDPALPSALRQIAAAAGDAGITLDAVSTPRPAVVDEATGLHAVSLTLTATGSYFQLVDFLRRIEDPAITARGITFGSLSLASTDYPTLTVSIAGEMYAVLDPVPVPEAEEPAPVEQEGDAAEDGAAAEGDGS